MKKVKVMKKVLLVLVMLISVIGFTQTSTKVINEPQNRILGFYSLEHNMSVNYDTGDTTYYVYMAYQNSEYTSIRVVESLFITKGSVISELITDLKIVIDKIGTGENFRFDRGEYSLVCYDFSNNLYIGDGKTTTRVHKKYALRLLTWLETIDLTKLR